MAARSSIARWKRDGLVKRSGRGKYTKIIAAATRTAVPGLDEPPAAEALAKALADLEVAKRNGRRTMARILQDKVELLQSKVAS